MSLLLATSSKFSCCSRVLSTLSSVIQKHLSLDSTGSFILANTTNLAMYGTQISSLYSCVAKPTVSGIWWQSANQNLYEAYVDDEQTDDRLGCENNNWRASPGGNIGSERDAVIDEGERSRARDVFPLCWGCPAWQTMI